MNELKQATQKQQARQGQLSYLELKECYTFTDELAFIEKFIEYAKKAFFENTSKKIVVTLDDCGSRAYGGVSVEPLFTNGIIQYHLLKINPNFLKVNNTIEELIDTILHELIHLYHLEKGLKDVSNQNRYHNKIFKNKAVETGLKVKHLPVYGFNTCGLENHLKEKILQEFINEYNGIDKLFTVESIKSFRQGQKTQGQGQEQGQKKDGKKSSNNLQVYICPVCGMKARARKNAHLICGDCMEMMNAKE
jgi:hypothetical protein